MHTTPSRWTLVKGEIVDLRPPGAGELNRPLEVAPISRAAGGVRRPPFPGEDDRRRKRQDFATRIHYDEHHDDGAKMGRAMLWTIDSALDDDLIRLIARNDDMGIYEFRVGELKTIVTVEVGRLPSSERARYHRSHDIKTPLQGGPYHQSPFCWDNVPYALHQAIGSITTYYRLAIADGHEPREEWLVERRSAWPWRRPEDP